METVRKPLEIKVKAGLDWKGDGWTAGGSCSGHRWPVTSERAGATSALLPAVY